MEWFVQLELFFYWMNLENTSKKGKNQSKVSMESGVSVCVCRAGGETEEQRRSEVNCNQAKTREEDKMKAALKKSLDGSTDEEADWGW